LDAELYLGCFNLSRLSRSTFFDASDSFSDKYRNGEAIVLTAERDSAGMATIALDSNLLSKHFGTQISEGLTVAVPFERLVKDKKAGVLFQVPSGATGIIADIAKISGKDDDIFSLDNP
jgi:hypothetical protein